MNFLLVPLHSQTLGTASYADNTTFYVYAAFFNVLLTYGMETTFFRFFSRATDKNKVFSTTHFTLLITTFLVCASLYAYHKPLAEFFNMNSAHLQLLLGVLALDTMVVAPFAYLRATNKVKFFTLIKLLNIAVYTGLNIYFLWGLIDSKNNINYHFFETPVTAIFVANFIASAFTFLLLAPLWRHLKWAFDVGMLKKMLRYGTPIMVAGLAFVVNENLDKLLLQTLIDKETMGAYSGCYKLAVLMTLFVQGFRMGAVPFFFNHASDKNAPKTYATIMHFFVFAGCLIMLLVVTQLDWLKALLIRDPDYWMALEIVPIVLLANLFLGIYHNLAIWYMLTDRTQYGMYISILGALLTIALNWWLIPKMGFMAAAWATLAAYGTMAIISYLWGQRHYAVPYACSKIGLYLILASVFSALSFYHYYADYQMGAIFVFVFLLTGLLLEFRSIRKILNL